MPRPTPLSASTHLVRRMRERVARGGRDEGGFILLETMIALTLITVIMAAVSLEYVNGMVVSAQQRSMTTASQAATSAMADLRGLDSTDLLTGRGDAAVIDQRNRLAAIPKVAPWISANANRLTYDNASGTPLVPTTRVESPSPGRTFWVDKYLECTLDATVSGTGATKRSTCGAVSKQGAMRAVVVVTWSASTCPQVTVGTVTTRTCAFVTATLIDSHANPTFDLNQTLPPAPVAAAVADQVKSIGDRVSLQLLVQEGKGASPFSWALTSGTLPSGLELSPAGLISGTVTANATATTTFTVTDAFLRTSQITFGWSVTPPLVVTKPADQVSVTGTDATPFDLAITGGSSPYTVTDPGATLPTGVTLTTAGRIAGRPTRSGDYVVSLTVSDKAGRTTTTSFGWTVSDPVAISKVVDQTATADQVETFVLNATGGSGTFTYSARNLPSWLTLRPSADTRSVTVTGRAPSSVGTTTNIAITATDANGRAATTDAFQIRVVAKPTVTTPGTQQTTTGGNASVQVAAVCANTPCSYAIVNQPGGLSISSSGLITGAVTASPQSFSQVRVTVTDAAGAQATTSAFTWTINATMTWATVPNQVTVGKVAASLDVSDYLSRGTAPYTFTATSLPAGLSINSDTGVISGTTTASNTEPTVRVTARDASGTTATTTFTWYDSNLAMPITDRSYVVNRAMSFDVTPTGGMPGYSFAQGGTFPSGVQPTLVNATTVRVSGTPRETGVFTAVLQVRDSEGAVVTTTFKITVTAK